MKFMTTWWVDKELKKLKRSPTWTCQTWKKVSCLVSAKKSLMINFVAWGRWEEKEKEKGTRGHLKRIQKGVFLFSEIFSSDLHCLKKKLCLLFKAKDGLIWLVFCSTFTSGLWRWLCWSIGYHGCIMSVGMWVQTPILLKFLFVSFHFTRKEDGMELKSALD